MSFCWHFPDHGHPVSTGYFKLHFLELSLFPLPARESVLLLLSVHVSGILVHESLSTHTLAQGTFFCSMKYWSFSMILKKQKRLVLLRVCSFGMIQIRISDPRTLRSWCIKETEGSLSRADLSVPSNDVPWWEWSWITDPDLDHPAGEHPN